MKAERNFSREIERPNPSKTYGNSFLAFLFNGIINAERVICLEEFLPVCEFCISGRSPLLVKHACCSVNGYNDWLYSLGHPRTQFCEFER